jgi:NDP-sugar pyrophosphorylase family protein
MATLPDSNFSGLPQVVILAGGLGTRLRSVAGDTPKILVPVRGRPFVEWQFELLLRHKATDVLMCVGHGAEHIESHVGDGGRFGMRVRYSHEDPGALLGTGGALVRALPALADRFLVLYGDSYLPVNYLDFAGAFARSGHLVMMAVYRNLGRWDRSNVRVANGSVTFYDKNAPPGAADCIDYGLIGLTRRVIESRRHEGLPLDLAPILGDAVRQGGVAAWMAPERFYEIGSPAGLAELETHLAESHS